MPYLAWTRCCDRPTSRAHRAHSDERQLRPDPWCNGLVWWLRLHSSRFCLGQAAWSPRCPSQPG
eukprot:2460302-Alexandrium_andersonii.AAC.1